MKQGFTLVELSIVLVIIGMLIGGILVGQSLIQSAKINSAVNQIGQFDIAVRNFKSKYKCPPGDSPTFPYLLHPALPNNKPNCDGKIRDRNDVDVAFEGDAANAWRQLSDSGFGSKKYGQNLYTGQPWRNEIPEFKLGKNQGISLITSDGLANVSGHASPLVFTNNETIYSIMNRGTGSIAMGNWDGASATISPKDMLPFDQKMDDGLPVTGRVRATNGWDVVGKPTTPSSTGGAACVLDNLSGYQIYDYWSADGTGCSMAIQVEN